MICPRCVTGLTVDTHRGVAFESCRDCGGMFLDHGELNRVAEPTAGDLEFSTVHEETFSHEDAFGPTNCPRCADEPMKKVEFNVYSGIVLDYCERCSGFWLDGKELDRINEEVHKLNEAVQQPDHSFAHWFALFIWSLPR